MAYERKGMTHKIMSGLFWTASGKSAQAVLQFVVIAILARLMTPLEFGVVAAAMIVVGFSEIITRLGLGPALVQRGTLEDRHLGTAFSVSLFFSVSIGLLIWIFAPFAAGFFNYQGIEDVLRALAWLFPIRGIGIVGESLAQRGLSFRWLANTDVFCFVLGYVVFGIGMAFAGYGIWALVAANLVTAAAKTILLLTKYPPRFYVPDRTSFAELIYFGGGHTIARTANYLALQGDNLVVGKMLGLASLGIYGRAYQLMSTPATLFGQVLDDVLFPSMAKMQFEKERLATAYFRGVSLIALVMLPTSVVAAILAPELVYCVLGPAWSDVVLPFRILAAGLLLRTSYKMSDSLSRATGAVYRRSWRQIVYAALVIGGSWIGHFWGVSGVAAGVLAALLTNYLLMAQMSLQIVGRSWAKFFQAQETALMLSAAVSVTLLPAVVLMRTAAAPPLAIILAAFAVISGSLILIVKLAPQRFLGPEGLWMLDILLSYAPDKYRARYAFGVSDDHDKHAGKPTVADNIVAHG
ncbi:MAG: lipopolysaccharide biosynthesis protein [Acidobacteriota bacterium]